MKVVEILLEAGASVEANGIDGETALVVANREHHVEVVNILLRAGANVEAVVDITGGLGETTASGG